MSRAGYWDFQTNSYSADDLCDTVAAAKLEGTLMMLCIYQLTVIIPISTTHALSAHLRVGRVQSLLCCSVIDPCSAHQPVRCTLIVNNNGDSLFNGHCKVHSEMILPLAVLESHSRFAPLACPPIGLGGLTLVSTNWWCPVAAICPTWSTLVQSLTIQTCIKRDQPAHCSTYRSASNEMDNLTNVEYCSSAI